MDNIQLKAYAKINLGLDVIRKRDDGYHEVKMIMQSINMYDELILKKNNSGSIVLTTNESSIPTDERNLVYKAIMMLKNEFNIEEGIEAYLEKNIPVEAGMAGGSTDCAATLKGMNKLFNLNLNEEELKIRGKKLGADVPYCIIGGTALSEGIGEVLTKIKTPPQCIIVIAKPAVGVSTKFVYENLKIDQLDKHPDIDGMIEDINNNDLYAMAKKMDNVLETVTIPAYPVISEIKQIMIDNGAINSLMSGSGPTVFGIYDSMDKAKETLNVLKPKDYMKTCCITEFI